MEVIFDEMESIPKKVYEKLSKKFKKLKKNKEWIISPRKKYKQTKRIIK